MPNNCRLVCGPEGSPNSCFALYELGTGRELVFIQTDWDYPSLAQSLGWSLQEVEHAHLDAEQPCFHSGTDGTVDCPDCIATATEFISAAYDWLYAHDGDEFECHNYDPEE